MHSGKLGIIKNLIWLPYVLVVLVAVSSAIFTILYQSKFLHYLQRSAYNAGVSWELFQPKVITSAMASRFDCVEQGPPIEVFQLMKLFTEDTYQNKVNLSVGGKY